MHLSSSSTYLTTFFVKRLWTTLMVSLLLFVEVVVIPQFELVHSYMQTTSQSLVTQLTKRNFFRRLEMNASKVGLKINLKKTKILHAEHNSQPSPVTTINGYTLDVCNDILFLGVSTKTPLNVVQEKIGRACFSIGKYRPIFICKISNANKMHLSKATVETIAAHGLESVPMTRSLCRQIVVSHRHVVRAALTITWPETISTAELTKLAKLIPLSRTIRKRRLRLVGHVIRMRSRCQTPIRTLLTIVPSNFHIR